MERPGPAQQLREFFLNKRRFIVDNFTYGLARGGNEEALKKVYATYTKRIRNFYILEVQNESAKQLSEETYATDMADALAKSPSQLDFKVNLFQTCITRTAQYHYLQRLWPPTPKQKSDVHKRNLYALIFAGRLSPAETGLVLGISKRQVRDDLEQLGREDYAAIFPGGTITPEQRTRLSELASQNNQR